MLRSIVLSIILLLASQVFASENGALLENEKNTISIFKNSVDRVVNVSNIKIARRGGWFFDADVLEIPAGQGTGFVWDDKGHIVTNYHVIADGDSFLISFHNDQKQYKAKVVGAEPRKDIAVLKLEEMPQQIIPIKVGESKTLEVGQKALAIGNPFGLDHTITEGIISALDRKIPGYGGVSITGMIQTDCSINPGNSGGPLLNSSGELIGMNTMIFSNSGSSAGVGFAVPVSTIKQIVPDLIKYGKVVRPGLGIGILEDRVKNYFGITEGLVIKYIDPKGGAHRAGLKGMGRDSRGRYHIGDIILEIDGKKVNNYDDIYLLLENYKIGDVVTVKYVRDGKTMTTKVTLIEV
ncbi:MAG: trypsin-like peptidase domain-containing protein [Bdellovibrio sp.]